MNIEDSNLSDILCLTGSISDKEIVLKYSLKTPTIRNWKNRTLNDEDAWKRIAYELFVRYVSEKDIYINKDFKNCASDIKRNITTLEISEKDYYSFLLSTKTYKHFLVSLIEKVPADVFKKRVFFLKECIESSKMLIQAKAF